MAIQFQKATKKRAKLRLAITGPSGSGKTYTALKVATEMDLGKIAVIDTERGSASKYSDIFAFDVLELDGFHPERYIEAIAAAVKAGYDILIIDSITHEWNGTDGILELHEAAIRRQQTKNSYTAWADVTPLHTRFIDAIVQCQCHVITTMRSKVDYLQESDARGKTSIRKVGMAPIQREGMDYEHDVVMDMDIDHAGVISKTRCAALDGKVFKKPGRELAEPLVAWLSDGAEPAPEKKAEVAAPAPQKPTLATDPAYEQARMEIIADLKEVYTSQGKTESDWDTYVLKLRGKSADDLEALLKDWKKEAAKRKAATAPAPPEIAAPATQETVSV